MVHDELEGFSDGLIDLNEVTLVQQFPAGLQLVDGSASEPPTSRAQVGTDTLLRWKWDQDAIQLRQPYTVTYQVQPVQPGTWTIGGSLELVDTERRQRTIPAPAQVITVTDAVCNPTPTPPPTATPPPTDTPTATATPLPPTPTATPTAMPTPHPIYLPVVINESCAQQWVYADVALVLDASTSMNRLTRTGRTKLAATQDAAKAFVGLMDFTPNASGQHDQVAVVGFNQDAWIAQELANDPAAIQQAIDELPRRQAEGTRLDLAFARGAEALRPERRLPGNTPVLILLTDGLPNQVPTPVGGGAQEDTVLAAAGRAKDAGIRVYTIAIGSPEDTNPDLLRACASDASLFRYTPDAEDLGAIYTEIAYAVGCPAERFWGGR